MSHGEPCHPLGYADMQNGLWLLNFERRQKPSSYLGGCFHAVLTSMFQATMERAAGTWKLRMQMLKPG
eukprot:6757927-Pyramimonas_sp.AAC.1